RTVERKLHWSERPDLQFRIQIGDSLTLSSFRNQTQTQYRMKSTSVRKMGERVKALILISTRMSTAIHTAIRVLETVAAKYSRTEAFKPERQLIGATARLTPFNSSLTLTKLRLFQSREHSCLFGSGLVSMMGFARRKIFTEGA